MNIGYTVAQIHCTDVNHFIADGKGVKDFCSAEERQIQIFNVKPQIFSLRKNLGVKTHSNMNIGYAVAQIHCTDVNHVVADANGVKDFGTSRQPHRFPNFLN